MHFNILKDRDSDYTFVVTFLLLVKGLDVNILDLLYSVVQEYGILVLSLIQSVSPHMAFLALKQLPSSVT